jgi:hypothetical protein
MQYCLIIADPVHSSSFDLSVAPTNLSTILAAFAHLLLLGDQHPENITFRWRSQTSERAQRRASASKRDQQKERQIFGLYQGFKPGAAQGFQNGTVTGNLKTLFFLPSFFDGHTSPMDPDE